MPKGSLGSTDIGAASAFSADDSPSREKRSWTTGSLRPQAAPPLPQHQAYPPSTHTPALFPPNPVPAPGPSVPMQPMADNDWDLSSMLLVEMGYMSQSDSIPESILMKEGVSFGSEFFVGQTPPSDIPAVGGVTGGDVGVGPMQSADRQPYPGRLLGGAGKVGQLPDAKMPFRADASSLAAASAAANESDPMSYYGQHGLGMTYADALQAMSDTQGSLSNPEAWSMWTDAPAAFGWVFLRQQFCMRVTDAGSCSAEDWSEFISQFAPTGPGQ